VISVEDALRLAREITDTGGGIMMTKNCAGDILE